MLLGCYNDHPNSNFVRTSFAILGCFKSPASVVSFFWETLSDTSSIDKISIANVSSFVLISLHQIKVIENRSTRSLQSNHEMPLTPMLAIYDGTIYQCRHSRKACSVVWCPPHRPDQKSHEMRRRKVVQVCTLPDHVLKEIFGLLFAHFA